MQVVIPMSGKGSRFLSAGYTDPKPLIQVDGKTIIEHIVSLFPGETKFIFVCSEDHLKTTPMEQILRKICPTGKICAIPPHKLGPVYAALQGSHLIDDSGPTIVSYCDYFLHWDYNHFKKKMKELDCDGCVPCYKGFHPHLLYPNLYAGVKVDDRQFMTEIREKFSFTENKMDTWQSSGVYYFKSGSLMKKYFHETMEQNLNCNGEFYVSLVYNLLVRDHLNVYVYPHDYFCQWGTPQDLEMYKTWSNYFTSLARQNNA